MQEIIWNLAHIHVLTRCRELGIDCAGSHLVKNPRRWTYSLVRDSDGLSLISVTFWKNGIPTYSYNKTV